MKLMRIAGVLVLAALALGLAACGDEEQDEQTSAELREAANKICDKYEKRIDEIEEPGNVRNSEQAEAYFGEVAGVVESAELDFSALDPNDELDEEWNAFVRTQREGKDLLTRVAEKATKRDRSYINDLSEIERIDRESDERARRVGASGCVD